MPSLAVIVWFAATTVPGAVTVAHASRPLAFEANHGQLDAAVLYRARAVDADVFLTKTGAVLTPRGGGAALQIDVKGISRSVRIVAEDERPNRSSFFRGNDASTWVTAVPSYSRIRYRGIYPGIDLVFHDRDGHVEYDFEIAAGADPDRIVVEFSGADRLRLEPGGALVIALGDREVRQELPRVTQDGREIEGRYVRRGASRIGFHLGRHDRSRPLVIDPVLHVSTYLGGAEVDRIFEVTVDPTGNIYVIGDTRSDDFPLLNPVQSTNRGDSDVLVTKLDPTGTQILFSTFLGGTATDSAWGIAVDNTGSAYLSGRTNSTDFPTRNPIQALCNQCDIDSGDAFVAKLGPTGSTLVYSSFIGGTDNEQVSRIVIDGSGSAYVVGATRSVDFPTTPGAWRTTPSGGSEVFAFKVNPTGSALMFSTYLGGSENDSAWGLAIDPARNLYIAGDTHSSGLATAGAAQSAYLGFPYSDGFLTKLNPSGSGLVWSTYLGGSSTDNAWAVALDPTGAAYVHGETESDDFPVRAPAAQPTRSGGIDSFVTKISPSGSAFLYSTFLGGRMNDHAWDLAVDAAGNAFAAGRTLSDDFPLHYPYQATRAGVQDGFISHLDPSGSTLLCSSYFGGPGREDHIQVALDAAGLAILTGWTDQAGFPLANPLQPVFGGGADGFVARLGCTAAPGSRVDTLKAVKTSGGASIAFTWSEVADAGGYDLYRATAKILSPLLPEGVAWRGAPGLVITTPAGPADFFQLLPANCCGQGPP